MFVKNSLAVYIIYHSGDNGGRACNTCWLCRGISTDTDLWTPKLHPAGAARLDYVLGCMDLCDICWRIKLDSDGIRIM